VHGGTSVGLPVDASGRDAASYGIATTKRTRGLACAADHRPALQHLSVDRMSVVAVPQQLDHVGSGMNASGELPVSKSLPGDCPPAPIEHRHAIGHDAATVVGAEAHGVCLGRAAAGSGPPAALKGSANHAVARGRRGCARNREQRRCQGRIGDQPSSDPHGTTVLRPLLLAAKTSCAVWPPCRARDGRAGELRRGSRARCLWMRLGARGRLRALGLACLV
jgi:hypothetical protein